MQDLTRVGRPNAEPPQDIQLQGLGITNEHCIIELVNREVFLTPMRGSRQEEEKESGLCRRGGMLWLVSGGGERRCMVSGGGERRCRRGGMVCGWSVGERRDGVGGEGWCL